MLASRRYLCRLPAERLAAARSVVREINRDTASLGLSSPITFAVAIDDGGVWIIASPFASMSVFLADQFYPVVEEMIRVRMGETL